MALVGEVEARVWLRPTPVSLWETEIIKAVPPHQKREFTSRFWFVIIKI